VVEPRKGVVSAEVEKVVEDSKNKVADALLSAKRSCAGGTTGSENLTCDQLIIENSDCSTTC
jgi:hypothetical protein